MIATLLVTGLLVFPAAALILVGDHLDPLAEAKNFSRKSARSSSDKTNLRIRLEELGKATDLDYEQFRIKQYGYSAGSAAIAFAFIIAVTSNLILAACAIVFAGAGIYLLIDRQLTQDIKKRRELIEAEFPAIVELLTLAIAAGETPLSECYVSQTVQMARSLESFKVLLLVCVLERLCTRVWTQWAVGLNP